MPTATLERDTDLDTGKLATTTDAGYETYTHDGHVTQFHFDERGQTNAMTNSAQSHYEYLREEDGKLYVIGYFQGTSFDKMLISECASHDSLSETTAY